MKELMKFNQEEKFGSLYLVEQINLFRAEEGSKSNLLHKDLLKKIRKEFEDEINEGNISPVDYKDVKGEYRTCFELNYEQSLQLLMSESKIVRKGVITKLKELTLKTQIPQTFAQALRAAADAIDQKELAEAKVQSLEQALDVSEDWISILRASKEYGVKETFFNWRELKEYSRDNGIEVKKAPCPRFGTKNLYHVSVFEKVYNIKK